MKFIHSFMHSGYFCSASSSPLPLRGAPDAAWILCRNFTAEAPQATASEGLVQGQYVAARPGLMFCFAMICCSECAYGWYWFSSRCAI